MAKKRKPAKIRKAEKSPKRKGFSPEERLRFEKARAGYAERIRPQIEAIEASQRITAEDLRIRINAKAD